MTNPMAIARQPSSKGIRLRTLKNGTAAACVSMAFLFSCDKRSPPDHPDSMKGNTSVSSVVTARFRHQRGRAAQAEVRKRARQLRGGPQCAQCGRRVDQPQPDQRRNQITPVCVERQAYEQEEDAVSE